MIEDNAQHIRSLSSPYVLYGIQEPRRDVGPCVEMKVNGTLGEFKVSSQ